VGIGDGGQAQTFSVPGSMQVSAPCFLMQLGVAARAVTLADGGAATAGAGPAAPEANGGDVGHSQSALVTGSMHLLLLILAIQ
jgi:hypothetical protein